MADDRPLVEQFLDAALFAPIGAIAVASEQVPALVERGRAALEGRVAVAKMVGRVAVGTARRRVGEAMAARDPAGPTARTGDRPPPPGDAPPGGVGGATARPTAQRRASVPDDDLPAPPVEDLAIPGYDVLAAAQVVQRLDALAPSELEGVRRYEQATRKRRTILARVAQLQGARGDA